MRGVVRSGLSTSKDTVEFFIGNEHQSVGSETRTSCASIAASSAGVNSASVVFFRLKPAAQAWPPPLKERGNFIDAVRRIFAAQAGFDHIGTLFNEHADIDAVDGSRIVHQPSVSSGEVPVFFEMPFGRMPMQTRPAHSILKEDRKRCTSCSLPADSRS